MSDHGESEEGFGGKLVIRVFFVMMVLAAIAVSVWLF